MRRRSSRPWPLAAALVALFALALPAWSAPPTPGELASAPPISTTVDPSGEAAWTEEAIDSAYDAGFWHATGGPLIAGGILTAIPGLTATVAGAIGGRGDVLGVSAILLGLAGAQIGFGAWFVTHPPQDGPLAARQAGKQAGAGAMATVWGGLLGAGAILAFTSDEPLSDTGGEIVAVPLSLALLGSGLWSYIDGKTEHAALLEGARRQAVSGVPHIRPNDSPRASVLTLFGARF